MKALGQVTTAVGYVGDAVKDLSVKIDTVSAEGRAEQKEAQARLEANAADTRMRLHDLRNDMHITINALDRNVAQLETGLANHITTDEQEFARIGASLSNSEKDRGSLWRILAGLSASGGIGAVIAKWMAGGES
tara:strand:+ start:1366 stop:1767 length:402 start_codon:yes stop_codon:yes gene_type:complete